MQVMAIDGPGATAQSSRCADDWCAADQPESDWPSLGLLTGSARVRALRAEISRVVPPRSFTRLLYTRAGSILYFGSDIEASR